MEFQYFDPIDLDVTGQQFGRLVAKMILAFPKYLIKTIRSAIYSGDYVFLLETILELKLL
jgi:hypothetical protein